MFIKSYHSNYNRKKYRILARIPALYLTYEKERNRRKSEREKGKEYFIIPFRSMIRYRRLV